MVPPDYRSERALTAEEITHLLSRCDFTHGDLVGLLLIPAHTKIIVR
jgi:hypothetical protein